LKVVRGLLGLLIIIVSFKAVAQKSNEKQKWVSGFDRPVILDSLSIVPGSIQVVDSTLKADIQYSLGTGEVRIQPRQHLDSILLRYKVYPYAMHSKVYHKNMEIYDSTAMFKSTSKPRISILNERREELFTTPNLNKSGVISRGITFGNRQDIFVNSVLNLQMDGRLSEKLNIRASITDQNIPYQPEGNTKLVQDFDNVFFQIYNDNFSLAGGDIVLLNPSSYFLRYHRNVQGAEVSGKYTFNDQVKSESKLSVSVSKGKFSSYQLDVLDGIMGPYKIYGPDNENFIIILANSERVYLDGRLLERGFNNDYVIDYNTAEITFTSRIMITKYSRIQIDFEYTNQAYSRTVVTASHHQNIKDLEVSVNYFQEKDNPNQPMTFELSDLEKGILSGVDPEQGNATIPGWDSIGFSEDRVLYKKIDTLDVSGNVATIFKQSDNPDSAFYQVVFTEVMMGKGDYVRSSSGQNGKIYEWVSPIDGISQGNFIPMRVVPLPKKKQMISVNTAYNLGRNNKFFTELAISNHNDNLYNKSSDGLKGIAIKSGFVTKDKKIGFLPGYFFTGQVDYEFNNKNFRAIDRFRPVEFNRDWSYNQARDEGLSNDNIFNVKAGIKKDNKNFLSLGVSQRKKAGYVNGWQAYSNGMYDMSRLHVRADFFMLNNDNGFDHSRWLRYRVMTYLKTKYFYPGYEYRVDRNVITRSQTDSVIYSADNFEEHLFFLRNSDTLKTIFNASYSIRKDRWPEFGEMVTRNIARTTNLMVGTGRGKLGKLDVNVTYRELAYLGNNTSPDIKSLLGRLDWSADFLKKHIRSEIMYAIGNGRELKREYVFIPVPLGEGTHTWRDDNQDGKQDLDEFYLAINNDERNYIKLFTPTDEYVLAYDNNLNYRLTLEMPRKWKNTHGIKKFLGRFSNNLNISLKQKTADDRFVDNLLFNHGGIFNDKLISYRDNIRNNLYFNRADPRYGFELLFFRLRNKQLLSEGFEARNSSNLKAISRLSINRDYNLRLTVGNSMVDNSSDFLENRNYLINRKSLTGTFEWQPTNSFRITTDYTFSDNVNERSLEIVKEASVINEALVNFKYAKAANKNIDLSFRFTHIDFTGEENSAVGYELLKALQPGKNITWTLSWQQKLFNGLQMNLFYEGRKSGDLDIIHIGRMQVMAMF
jgi:hypothetical protein